MSEVQLVLLDAERSLSGHIHGSLAEMAVAALCAEPETIEELETAMLRFHAGAHGSFRWFQSGVTEESYDAGLVVIDLAARLIACESTYFSPSLDGELAYHDGHAATEHQLAYHLPPDWTIRHEILGWEGVSEKLRAARATQPPLDARAVLMGSALLEFIAGECFAACRDHADQFVADATPPAAGDSPDDADVYPGESRDEADQATIRSIHARWLTTPRDDLRGRSPRDVLLADKDHIDRDMWDRCMQWSRLGACPPPLSEKSFAYRFAGFGTHQVVVYYELVRFLLWDCFGHLLAIPRATRQSLSREDFVAAETARLALVSQSYLDGPDREFSGRKPRELMEHERRRIPEGGSCREAMIDDDCPLCQMQAELPGVGFWHLDGCNMDDEFAFSLHRTQEDWDEERRKWEESSRRFDELRAEEARLGVDPKQHGWADAGYLWQRSFEEPLSAETPIVRLFAVGSLLCELACEVKRRTDDRTLLERLRRDWGNLREVVGATGGELQVELIDPVLDRFRETLSEVAEIWDELEPTCAKLRERLRRFCEPPGESSEPVEPDEDPMPF